MSCIYVKHSLLIITKLSNDFTNDTVKSLIIHIIKINFNKTRSNNIVEHLNTDSQQNNPLKF